MEQHLTAAVEVRSGRWYIRLVRRLFQATARCIDCEDHKIDSRKIIGGEQESGLLSYFRHQTDTGLPRGRSDFCRSPGLPLLSS
jgi:hypothetical protein